MHIDLKCNPNRGLVTSTSAEGERLVPKESDVGKKQIKVLPRYPATVVGQNYLESNFCVCSGYGGAHVHCGVCQVVCKLR